jgi:hypothetical protein
MHLPFREHICQFVQFSSGDGCVHLDLLPELEAARVP